MLDRIHSSGSECNRCHDLPEASNPPPHSDTLPDIQISSFQLDNPCPHCHPAPVSTPFSPPTRELENPPVDPELETLWTETLSEFRTAIDADSDLATVDNLFAKITEIGIKRHHLGGSYEELEESKLIQSQLELDYKQADHFFHSTAACHTSPADVRRMRTETEIYGSLQNQNALVAERERIRSESLAGLESDLLDVLHGIEGETLAENDLPDELTLSWVAASIFAETFRDLHDFERAQKYYYIASATPDQTETGRQKFQLLALELDVLSGDREKVQGAIKEIEEIRGNFEELHALIRIDADMRREDPEAFEEKVVDNTVIPPPPLVGSHVEVHELEALSWGILHKAYLGLADMDMVDELEKERRTTVRSRIGKATEVEAQLHLRNMEEVAYVKTVNDGMIEQALRSEDSEAAERVFNQLVQDVGDIHKLIAPHMKKERGDVFFEGFASLNWKTFFDGYVAQDLPQTALYYLNDFVLQPSVGPQICMGTENTPEENAVQYENNGLDDDYDAGSCPECESRMHKYYDRSSGRLSSIAPWLYEGGQVVGFAEADAVATNLDLLRRMAPQVFTEDGLLNPDIDLSDTEAGQDAADRTQSAYWSSNDTVREIGVPAGGAFACFAASLPLSETLVVPVIAAFVCGLGGSFLNREINESNAFDQYQQAAMTGISRTTAREAFGNKGSWYLDTGVSNLFAATLMPSAAVWGWLGLSGLKSGLARAATWLLGEGVGRAVSDVAAKAAGVASKFVVGLGKAAKGSVRWYFKLPLGTKLRSLGLVPAGADYGFIDREGDLVSWDGKLDHWYGYAGLAAAVSMGGYGVFRKFLQPDFARALASSNIRNTIARLGWDAIAADYYLIKKDKDGDYSFVDFDAPRENVRQEHMFEKQFGLDTYVGYAGLLMAGGDWLRSEWKIMGAWDRRLLIGGGVPFVADCFSDGELDEIYGGFGGSFAIAALGYRLLNVSAGGSIASIFFKLIYEWSMQAMQDQPLSEPDARRLIAATGESIAMLMFIQGTHQGTHYFNRSPFGRNIVKLTENIPGIGGLRSMEDLSRYGIFGDSRPSIEGYTMVKVTPQYVRQIGEGGKEFSFRLRGDKRWRTEDEVSGQRHLVNGVAVQQNGNEDIALSIIQGAEGTETKFYLNGKLLENGEQFLRTQGYEWRSGVLHEAEPLRRGTIQWRGRRMTVSDLDSLNEGYRNSIMAQLARRGIRIQGDRFENPSWIEHPYRPDVLDTAPSGPMSTPAYKIFQTTIKENGTERTVWLRFSRTVEHWNSLVLGGREIETWTNIRAKPHFTFAGGLIQAGPAMAEAYGVNRFIFLHATRGDPDYQPKQRMVNYAFASTIIWPFFQARLGMASFWGRSVGGLIGFIPVLGGNWIYPTYRNSTPGFEMFRRHLEAGGSASDKWYYALNSSDAMDSVRRMITSGDIWGGIFGSCGYDIEEAAMKNIRGIFDCLADMSADIDFGDSNACVGLPLATQTMIEKTSSAIELANLTQYFDVMAELYEKKMNEERETDLSEIDRRTLVMMGAWFKTMMKDESYSPTLPNGERIDTLESIRELSSRYQWFFDQIPDLRTERDWEDFTDQVNEGRSCVSRFNFDPRMQSSN